MEKTVGPYRVEVIADSSGKFCGNALRFDSIDDGIVYARDLARRWTLVTNYRVVEDASDEVKWVHH